MAPAAARRRRSGRERELLQHSLSALYASMGAKEQELARAHAGRRRLRAARTLALTFALTFALTLPLALSPTASPSLTPTLALSRRLRAALAEQRDCSDAQIGELQRQMLQVGLGARLGLQHLALALMLSLTYP